MKSLTNDQIDQFIKEGFVKIVNAIPVTICEQVRDILWKDTGVNPLDPSTWTKPVIRLGDYSQEPFRIAANMPVLINSFNQLVGEGKWLPRGSLGTFPIRFPSNEEPGDTGWHVDASFSGKNSEDIISWRCNIYSEGRALLMLFLFSDVSDQDAPTKIKVGSHIQVAKILQPYERQGLSFMELAGKLNDTLTGPDALATGTAGTVYLCHPFIVHAAQPHQGTTPRFLAQPPLQLKKPLDFSGSIEEGTPLEKSIRLSLR